MKTLKTINREEARIIINVIIEEALKDGGEPVVVAVAGVNGHIISMDVMDGAMPASIKVAISKSYTAIMTKRDTIVFQEGGTDAANFTDPNITSFAGGVLLRDKEGDIIGSVAVSGRKGFRTDDMEHKIPQDHELAKKGAQYIAKFL